MQKIPAILKSRHSEAKADAKAVSTEIKKVVERQICALLMPKKSVELLYTHVHHEVCGQE